MTCRWQYLVRLFGFPHTFESWSTSHLRRPKLIVWEMVIKGYLIVATNGGGEKKLWRHEEYMLSGASLQIALATRIIGHHMESLQVSQDRKHCYSKQSAHARVRRNLFSTKPGGSSHLLLELETCSPKNHAAKCFNLYIGCLIIDGWTATKLVPQTKPLVPVTYVFNSHAYTLFVNLQRESRSFWGSSSVPITYPSSRQVHKNYWVCFKQRVVATVVSKVACSLRGAFFQI